MGLLQSPTIAEQAWVQTATCTVSSHFHLLRLEVRAGPTIISTQIAHRLRRSWPVQASAFSCAHQRDKPNCQQWERGQLLTSTHACENGSVGAATLTCANLPPNSNCTVIPCKCFTQFPSNIQVAVATGVGGAARVHRASVLGRLPGRSGLRS